MNPPSNAINPEEHRPKLEYAVIHETENLYPDLLKEKLDSLGLFHFDKTDNLQFTVAHFKEEYFILETKATYKGTWLNGRPQGKGKFFYPDDTLYEGYVEDGVPHKKGRKIFPNGDYYIGGFELGEFEGGGEYHQHKGVKLIGNFKKGVLNGEGKEQWPNMITYNGQFKNGKKHGKGKLEYPVEKKKKKKKKNDKEEQNDTEEERIKEEYYEGMFENGEFNGNGVYVWSDGRKYEGGFKHGKMNGHGVFTWKDERKYVGYYLDDTKHGLGEYSWPDGRRWKGGWKLGLQHGRGVLIKTEANDTETVKRGIWIDGKFSSWLDPMETEWPKGIDEVDMNIFQNEDEAEEEEIKKSGLALMGKIGDLLGKAQDMIEFKSTIQPNLDYYLKEYCKNYTQMQPDGTPRNNKNRDPKDNIFIRKSGDAAEDNNCNMNAVKNLSFNSQADKKDTSVIRQEISVIKQENPLEIIKSEVKKTDPPMEDKKILVESQSKISMNKVEPENNKVQNPFDINNIEVKKTDPPQEDEKILVEQKSSHQKLLEKNKVEQENNKVQINNNDVERQIKMDSNKNLVEQKNENKEQIQLIKFD